MPRGALLLTALSSLRARLPWTLHSGVDESVFETALQGEEAAGSEAGDKPKKRGRKKKAASQAPKASDAEGMQAPSACLSPHHHAHSIPGTTLRPVELALDVGEVAAPSGSSDDELLFEQALKGLDLGPLGDDEESNTGKGGGG